MSKAKKDNKPLIIGVVAALLVVGAIAAVILLTGKKGDNGGGVGGNDSSLEAVTTMVDLTGSNYDKAKLMEIFSEKDMSKSTRVTAFGAINATQRKDKGENVYDYYFTPLTDKKEGDEITWKEAFKDTYELPGLANLDKIEESTRPVRGDLVNVTGVWKQDVDPKASDYAFEFYVEKLEIVGKTKQ